MLNKDEIRGKAKRVKGAIRENLGWLTDDHQAEGQGKGERLEGKAQERDGKLRRETETTKEELAKAAASSQ